MSALNLSSWKVIFSLASFGVFLGLFLGLVMSLGHTNLNLGLNNEEIDKHSCTGECRFNESHHNVDWITQRVNGTLYSFNKPNISGKADRLGLDPFYVDTNLKGLRDEDFQADKPQNLTRVLVLGTSTTFGFGVERNQTFLQIAERKLKDKISGDIQVLNAGSPGYGMEDYYYFLKTRGVEYEPDVVVIASNSIIWRSREDADEVNKLAGKQLQRMNASNLGDQKRRQLLREFVFEELQDRMDGGIENTGMKYIYDIQRIANQHGIDLLYYSINGLPYPGQKKYIESWADQAGEEVYYAPNEYIHSSDKYDHSSLDTHPNAQGHRIISRGFYAALSEELEAAKNLP